MAFEKNNSIFTEGVLLYIIFVVPEILLIFNLPLNIAIVRFIINGNFIEFKESITDISCVFSCSVILLAFIYRYLKCLFRSSNPLVVTHQKWLKNTFEIFLATIVGFVVSIMFIINGVQEEPSKLFKYEVLTVILTIMMSVSVLYFVVREIVGFSCFIKMESPTIKILFPKKL